MLESVISRDHDCVVAGMAADAETAYVLMQKSAPDIITLDLSMPGIGGIGFLDAIAAKRHPPILVVSSLTGVDCAATIEALEHGADACFDKHKIVSEAAEFMRLLKKTAKRKRPVKPPAKPTPASPDPA
jgi:two-component system chemotaxis response regulator CheB